MKKTLPSRTLIQFSSQSQDSQQTYITMPPTNPIYPPQIPSTIPHTLVSSNTTAVPPPHSLTKPPSSTLTPPQPLHPTSSPTLTLQDFTIIRQIGSGDIGTVYLCRFRDTDNEYAMKVVDRDALAKKNKTHRAETEKRILKLLDHPFLPTLYAEFEAQRRRFSCILMEFCPGGDLYSLRHRQPFKTFSITSARFYAAEVLVALEYLHMLGIIYRDLKPENVLVKSDGHIMLSDFDLSLSSSSSSSTPPTQSPPTPNPGPSTTHKPPSRKTSSTFSCFPTSPLRPRRRLFHPNKLTPTTPLPLLEPITTRSHSFVGTHEYIPPEIASAMSHGNAVDWWAYGIFIYEMVYGQTPFVGPTNDATLRNILKHPLAFPTPSPSTPLESHLRHLLSRLLQKDPAKRLGSNRGAVELKTHPFFKGVHFALLRSQKPPAIPSSPNSASSFNKVVANRMGNGGGESSPVVFEYF